MFNFIKTEMFPFLYTLDTQPRMKGQDIRQNNTQTSSDEK